MNGEENIYPKTWGSNIAEIKWCYNCQGLWPTALTSGTGVPIRMVEDLDCDCRKKEGHIG